MFFAASLFILFFTALLYFRIARYFSIIDHPNHRSSHTKVTIRGCGILFPLAAIIGAMYSSQYYWFTAGLLAVALVSFADDVRNVSNVFRFVVHLAAVALLFFQVNLPLPYYWYGLIVILVIGVLNAWNFMDGINGIMGVYSLVTLATFYYINQFIQPFTNTNILLAVIAALIVFNYFNFRKRAKCFAGDVGSVSIAFICCFLMAQLIAITGNLLFLGLPLVYGLDVVSTILFRLIRRENIFEAHRSHFYQFLANEREWPHLAVASLYAGIQLLINFGVVQYLGSSATGLNMIPLLVIVAVGAMLFAGIRWKAEGKKRLLMRTDRI